MSDLNPDNETHIEALTREATAPLPEVLPEVGRPARVRSIDLLRQRVWNHAVGYFIVVCGLDFDGRHDRHECARTWYLGPEGLMLRAYKQQSGIR
jgi:hypothetical protein